MAHTPADGPLGLEGRHQFKAGDEWPPGTQASVFMYGSHYQGRAASSSSWIVLDRITGLHGLGDADDFRQPAEGRSGEVIYPSAARGRTMVYEGRIVGSTLQNLRLKVNALREVAAETRERIAGSITIVDPLSTSEGYGTSVRTLALDVDEVQAFGPTHLPYVWVRPFSLTVRAHDPNWVWYPVQSDLNNSAGSTQVISNQGNAPAEMQFDVFSNASTMDVTLENLTSGKKLVFEGMPIPSGDLLRVDWNNRAAVWALAANLPDYNPNTDMMPYMNLTTSDWWNALEWGLGPGNNSIKVSGTGIADWDIYWQHASY